jgi:hypothetical protein
MGRIGEWLTGRDELRGEISVLQEQVQQRDASLELMQESVADLELALEDVNWMRLTSEGNNEFSREGLRKITELARMMYMKNPLVKRSVLVKALYVWAQGITVRAKHTEINQVLQDFWDDKKNRAELTGHRARFLKEIDLEVSGNLFFVFFPRPSDGRVRIRTIPEGEIAEIICNPEDAKSPWFYKRSWRESKLNPASGRMNKVNKTAYYPDWELNPDTQPEKIGNWPVMWNSPVYHVKTGGFSGWKFGVSEIYASIDWARAYKEFLEDWASLTRSYSRFAWRLTTKGGAKGVAAAKLKLNSTLGNAGTGTETNPAPATGSTFIGGEGVDMQPMQLRGANVAAEDGRRMLLMVAASAGLPETYFGDVSVGTLATAKTMDRPTELMMKERQTFWVDVLRDIIGYVLFWAVKAVDGPLKELGSIEKDEDGDERLIWNKGVKPSLDLDFPPILEHDVQAAVQAVVTALTLNGQQITLLDEPTATRMILNALAEDDVDEIMTQLFPDETASVADEASSVTRVAAAFAKLKEAISRGVNG